MAEVYHLENIGKHYNGSAEKGVECIKQRKCEKKGS